MKLSQKSYEIARWATWIVLPAISALYFGLGQIWGFPYIEQIVGSISIFSVFVGSVLGISKLENDAEMGDSSL